MSKTLIYGEIVRAQLENASANLTPVATGLLYYNTTSNEARIYNGTTWKSVLYSDFANASGSLPIANGGTGAATALAAFNALSPLTTKGDLLSRSTTDNVRVGVGVNGQVLTADSTTASGLAWKEGGSGGSGINFLQTSGVEWSFEATANGANPVGWSRYTSGAALPTNSNATLLTQIGTNNADWTFQGTTTTPLYGNVSALLTKTANNRQGHGIVTDILTITAGSTNDTNFISFNYDWGSATIANGDVVVYILDVTNGTLISPSTVNMPVGGKGVYRASFVSTSSTSYRLYIHQATTAATSYTLEIDQVVIGPAQNYGGPVIQGPVSYAPALSAGWGGATGISVNYSRDGEWLYLDGSLTTGTVAASSATIGLPSGLTAAASSFEKVVGRLWRNNASASVVKAHPMFVQTSSPTVLIVSRDDTASTGSPFSSVNATSILSNTEYVTFNAKVRIAEWAGSASGVGSNDVEYASWNGSATVYGPNGSLVPTITASAVSTATSHTITWQTPRQETDLIWVEINILGSREWTPVGLASGYSQYTRQQTVAGGANARFYGIGWFNESNKLQTTVSFGDAGAQTVGAGYATVGSNYPNNSGDRYRVVKAKSGQFVQFGLATSTAAGLVSGGRVPGSLGTAPIVAGNVGETISATPSGVTASGFNSTASCAAITLTPGVWLVTGCATGTNATRPTTGTSALGWDLYNLTTTTVLVRSRYAAAWNNAATANDSAYCVGSMACTVVTSVNATIQLRVRCDEAAAGTGTPTVNSFGGEGLLQAVRIA